MKFKVDMIEVVTPPVIPTTQTFEKDDWFSEAGAAWRRKILGITATDVFYAVPTRKDNVILVIPRERFETLVARGDIQNVTD